MAGDSVLWTIYNVQGLVEYSLTMPRNAVIAAMHRDSVWLLTSDDDGVQVLSRYRVSP